MLRLTLLIGALLVGGLVACTSEPDFESVIRDREERIAELSEPPAPQPVEYVVRAGDTLASIAATYETTVPALAATNAIRDVNVIEEGQRLVVGTTLAEPTPRTSPPIAVQQDLPEESRVFADVPRRTNLDDWRAPTYFALAIAGAVAGAGVLTLGLYGGQLAVQRTVTGSGRGGRRALRIGGLDERLARLARAIGRSVRSTFARAGRRIASMFASLGREVRSHLPSLPRIGIPTPSFSRPRLRRTPTRASAAVVAGPSMRERLGGIAAATGHGVLVVLRWSALRFRDGAVLGGRGTLTASRFVVGRGRSAAGQAIERPREQRRQAAESERRQTLLHLGATQLRLGLVDEAGEVISETIAALAPEEEIERGICLVRLAEVRLRQEQPDEAEALLGEAFQSLGAGAPADAYSEAHSLRLRLDAARLRPASFSPPDPRDR